MGKTTIDNESVLCYWSCAVIVRGGEKKVAVRRLSEDHTRRARKNECIVVTYTAEEAIEAAKAAFVCV